MKDLIAKLQMDANCALGAIWMHIDAREKRIAELEAQIAAASAPVVEQQPIGYTCQYDLDCLANYNNVTIFPEFDKDISPIALYTAPQAADTDKVLEESQIRKARDLTLDYAAMHFDAKNGRTVNSAYVVEYLRELKEAPLDASAIVGNSTALQAPVLEVPGWQLVPIEPTHEMVWAARAKGTASTKAEIWSAMLAAAPLPAAPVLEPKP